ncbi:MAG: hypothetical protein HY216_17830 [Candidatus Rokubacteria bacterium]|nr:hypothetical protein [Candidatus Rokubacteria bacterium]
MRLRIGVALVLFSMVSVWPAFAQDATARRDATRERLRQLLDSAGKRPDVSVEFRQSTKQPYNFVGLMKDRLANADALEIVISVSAEDTIHFRVFPHYKGAYINIDRAQDTPGLVRKLLRFSDANFLYWGIDNSGDVFSGYNFTLESGFPDNAMIIVIRSVRPLDQYVGDLRPFIDGSR